MTVEIAQYLSTLWLYTFLTHGQQAVSFPDYDLFLITNICLYHQRFKVAM